jgi:hypothetical protein
MPCNILHKVHRKLVLITPLANFIRTIYLYPLFGVNIGSIAIAQNIIEVNLTAQLMRYSKSYKNDIGICARKD